MMRKVFFMVFFSVAVLAVALMVMWAGEEGDAPDPTPVLSEKQKAMLWAESQGNTLFLYDVPGAEGYALCQGTQYLVKLRAGKRRSIALTGGETANLTLCKQQADSPSKYSKVRDLSGASAGDYLIWDSTGTLNWNRYR